MIIELTCVYCEATFPREKKFYDQAKRRGTPGPFCSQACVNKAKVPKRFCDFCGTLLERGQKKFCNRQCSGKKQSQKNANSRREKIEAWLTGDLVGHQNDNNFTIKKFIRVYLLEQVNQTCSKCGWGEKNPITGASPLGIHHIDGDVENSTPKNLEVLCPNCHSLTENYCSLNTDSKRRR